MQYVTPTTIMSKDRFADFYIEHMEPKPVLKEIDGVWFCSGIDPSNESLTLIGCGATKLDAVDTFVKNLPTFRKD